MAKEGMRWERRLRREKLLGVGAYGRAILVKDSGRSNARLVLKEIEMAGMRKKERDAAKQEAQLLEAMQHPNIVRCCGHFQRESKLCILLDFCSKGDLESLLKHRRGHLLPESCILSFLAQIALGIKHLHGRRILHRDIKSSNVFLCEGNIVKLGDMGISKVLSGNNDLASTAIGTPMFMSPEAIQAKPYSFSSDMWSLGCVLYEMMSLRHAFNANDMNGLVHRISKGRIMPAPQQYSNELRELVSQLLSKDPSKRPTINDVVATPLLMSRIENLSHTVSQDQQRRMLSNNERDILEGELKRRKDDRQRIDDNMEKIQEKRDQRPACSRRALQKAEQRSQQQRDHVQQEQQAMQPQHRPACAAGQEEGLPRVNPSQQPMGANGRQKGYHHSRQQSKHAHNFNAEERSSAASPSEFISRRPPGGTDAKHVKRGVPDQKNRRVQQQQLQQGRHHNCNHVKIEAYRDAVRGGLNIRGAKHAAAPGDVLGVKQELSSQAQGREDTHECQGEVRVHRLDMRVGVENAQRDDQMYEEVKQQKPSAEESDQNATETPFVRPRGLGIDNSGPSPQHTHAENHPSQKSQSAAQRPANAVEGVLAARQRRREEEVRQHEAQLMEAREKYVEEKKHAAEKNRAQYDSAINIGGLRRQQHQQHDEQHQELGIGDHISAEDVSQPDRCENTASEEGSDDEQLRAEMERLQSQRDAIDDKISHLQQTLHNDCSESDQRQEHSHDHDHSKAADARGALSIQYDNNKNATRIAVLRDVCERYLGQDLFGKLYTYLMERRRLIQDDCEVTDERTFRNELRGKLGPQHFQFVAMIDRLIEEESRASARP